MEIFPPRVVLYRDDLKPFCIGADANQYTLYTSIKERFSLPKEVRVTIFHVRDYFNIRLEEVIWTIFKLGAIASQPNPSFAAVTSA